VEKDMAKVETFKCDQCGKQKQETNHWFVITPGLTAALILRTWNTADITAHGVRHLCGQQCVVAELNQWMNDQSAKPTES
jgi:endogenous inhibitor of DNA gyrase (YacG/DUF329 family)